MEKLNISPDKLMESLMEESPDTFQPNYIFSDTEKSAPIEKITVSKSGRIDTYLQGIKYPYSGYPYRPMIKSACIIKRITRLFITSFPMHNKMNIIKLFIY